MMTRRGGIGAALRMAVGGPVIPPDSVLGYAISLDRAYNPYGGDYGTYGFGPSHKFFDDNYGRIYPEPPPAPVPEPVVENPFTGRQEPPPWTPEGDGGMGDRDPFADAFRDAITDALRDTTMTPSEAIGFGKSTMGMSMPGLPGQQAQQTQEQQAAPTFSESVSPADIGLGTPASGGLSRGIGAVGVPGASIAGLLADIKDPAVASISAPMVETKEKQEPEDPEPGPSAAAAQAAMSTATPTFSESLSPNEVGAQAGSLGARGTTAQAPGTDIGSAMGKAQQAAEQAIANDIAAGIAGMAAAAGMMGIGMGGDETGGPGQGATGTSGTSGTSGIGDPGGMQGSTAAFGGMEHGSNDAPGSSGSDSSGQSGGMNDGFGGGDPSGDWARGGHVRGRGGLADAARMVRGAGRYGDTVLAHINPREAMELGPATRNPQTGLPEFFLGDIFDDIGDFVGDAVDTIGDSGFFQAVLPVAGGILGGAFGGPFGAAAGSALGSLAAGKDIEDALFSGAISGIGAYAVPKLASNLGIGGLGEGLFGGGSSAGDVGEGIVGGAQPSFLQTAGNALTSPLALAGLGGAGLLGVLGGGRDDEDEASSVGAVQPLSAGDFDGLERPWRNLSLEERAPTPFQGDFLTYGQTGGEHKFWDEPNPRLRGYAAGQRVDGPGDGQDDAIDARLSAGEYIIPADIVSALGSGDNDSGADRLDQFMRNVRRHRNGGGVELPPKALGVAAYFGGGRR